MPTPGTRRLLSELGGVVFHNPFQDRISDTGIVSLSGAAAIAAGSPAIDLAVTDPQKVWPGMVATAALAGEAVAAVQTMPVTQFVTVLTFAARASVAATKQSAPVGMKESIVGSDVNVVVMMRNYNEGLP